MKNMHDYMKRKKKNTNALNLTADELIMHFAGRKKNLSAFAIFVFMLVALAYPVGHFVTTSGDLASIDLSSDAVVAMQTAPSAAAVAKRDKLLIPSCSARVNPFLPYRDLGDNASFGNDVSGLEIIEPPATAEGDSDALRVMDTVVSGILYDKFSPSAILNIEGNDYLVKKGDVVNNYKVLSIMQDSVTVKLGANTYKAGIGEILTEGTINHNDVSNLDKKFGGNNNEI